MKSLFGFDPPPTLADYRHVAAKLQNANRGLTAEPAGGSKPLVSVITVVRNAARTLPRTIETVRNQTYDALEYVVVDGGSTDGTLDVIESNRDVIDVSLSEPDSGIYDAFNKGVALSSGRYIQILNADDWMSPDQVERAVASLQQSGADFVFGDAWLHGWKGQDVFIPGDPGYGKVIRQHMPRLAQTTAYCSREIFEKIGLFRTTLRIASDYDWFLRAHLAGMRGMHDPSIVGHMLAGGISTTSQRTAIWEGFLISLMNGYPVRPCVKYWLSRLIFVDAAPQTWGEVVAAARDAAKKKLSKALTTTSPR